MEQREKLGGRPFTSGSHCPFRRLVDENDLMDMGYIGYPFTWNNHRAWKANIQERLDRGLSNTRWRLLFPQATIHHLLAFRSDHKPLILHSVPNPPSQPKPFRFEEKWIRDPIVGTIIAKAWDRALHQPDINQFMSNLKITKIAL